MVTRTEVVNQYRKFEGVKVEEVKEFLSGKDIHCVSCKEVFEEIPDLIAPNHNSLAIQLKKEDGTNLNGIPVVPCSCGYNNAVFKLLYQVLK